MLVNYNNILSRDPLNDTLTAWYLCLPGLTGGSTWYNLVRYPAASVASGSPLWHGALTNFGGTSTSGFTSTTRPNAYGHVAFDGSNDFVNCGPVINTTGDFTIALWVNIVSHLSGYDTILSQGDGAGGDFDLLLDASSHKFAFYLGSGGNNVTSTTTPSAGTWYHVAIPARCIANSSTWDIYINGIFEATHNQALTRTTTAINCYLGGSPTFTRPANILLDDVRIYYRLLSPGEISALYAESSYLYQHVLASDPVPYEFFAQGGGAAPTPPWSWWAWQQYGEPAEVF